MIAFSLTFPAGRYHATPWGRHVNEGSVEWPPSPWRLLRALIAVWKRTLPDVKQADVEPILRLLAASLPEFILPPAALAHTRHYMPCRTPPLTLVFDAFVVVPRGAQLIVCWPEATLETPQCRILHAILYNLSTLGRAESWCEAQIATRDEIEQYCSHPRALPVSGHAPKPDLEIVRLLCPDPDTAFESHLFFDRAGDRSKRTAPLYDPDWHICAETLWLHKKRWSDPPGSRWIAYARPRDCFKMVPPKQRHVHLVTTPLPQVVRFALDSAVLPLVTQTLPVAESVRRALLSIHGCLTERDGTDSRSAILSGRDDCGQVIKGHSHAYYLPTDEDGDGRLDHLTVMAFAGLDSQEMRAMASLHDITIWGRNNALHPLRAILLGHGQWRDSQVGPLRSSRVWESATPYIATRYAKTRGKVRVNLRSLEERIAFLTSDLRAQLRVVRPDLADIAENVEIEPLVEGGAFKIDARWRPLQFKRFRQRPSDDGGARLAGAFRLTLPQGQEVAGPIALGYSAHFGMGLFLPGGS